jgi:hypothetical protein
MSTTTRRAPSVPEPPYYRALKPLTVHTKAGKEKVYEPGQIVPEAKTWLRVEAWVRSRRLELVEA